MIWEFAGDFIRLGTTAEERQFRLTAASCAWNIASVPPEQRQSMLDRYMTEYLRFIALLWLALAATVKLFVPGGVLLVSYLARVSFGAVLNFAIWWLNP